MDLYCERCRAPIPAADVNLEQHIAKCRACNAIFDFGALAATTSAAAQGYAVPLRRRAAAPMPANLVVLEDSDGSDAGGGGGYRDPAGYTGPRLAIVRSWYTPVLFFFAIFCVFWNGFLFVWYASAAHVEGGARVAMMTFPLIHVSVGIGLVYFTICGFVNKTSILVRDGILRIRHAPLPWPGNRELPVAALSQLYCEEVVTHSKNGSTSTFSLSAMLANGRKLVLLKSLPSADQALFIEQRVEEALGIVNVPVAGEYRA